MSPASEPAATGRLVYDADSDRIVLFTDAYYREIWTYDLLADRWARVGQIPFGLFPTGRTARPTPRTARSSITTRRAWSSSTTAR